MILTDPRYVRFVPVLAMVLLESANVLQLVEMWSTGSSLGQSPWGWVCVNAALLLWLRFYNTFTPERRGAIWATRVGVCINATVIYTVCHFRYLT